jgi:hypothetical protein
MTKEQLELLHQLIHAEIEYAAKCRSKYKYMVECECHKSQIYQKLLETIGE